MILFWAVTAAILVGCGGGGSSGGRGGAGGLQLGGERQSCYPNGTCNAGLVCLSDVCVNPANGGQSGAGGRGGSGSGTGGSALGTGGSAAGIGGSTGGTGGSAAGAGGSAGNGGATGNGGSAARGGNGGTGGGTGCAAPATYGDLGVFTTPSATTAFGNDFQWNSRIDSAPAHYVVMDLSSGFGVFSPNVKTGVFSISGAETQFATCGLCLLIERTDAQGNADATYLASGGVVTITSITGMLSGTLTDVTFQHVTIDSSSFSHISTPHPDGCTTAISKLKFDLPISM